MASPPDRTFDITCPCCTTRLKIDSETGVILSEVRPKGPTRSFEEAVALEKERGNQIDSAFKKAFTTVEHEKDILEKKLREAMKKAREEKDKPLPPRPIDLD